MLTDSQNTSDFFLDDSMLNMSSISAGISNDFQSVLDSTEFSGDLNTSNMQPKCMRKPSKMQTQRNNIYANYM